MQFIIKTFALLFIVTLFSRCSFDCSSKIFTKEEVDQLKDYLAKDDEQIMSLLEGADFYEQRDKEKILNAEAIDWSKLSFKYMGQDGCVGPQRVLLLSGINAKDEPSTSSFTRDKVQSSITLVFPDYEVFKEQVAVIEQYEYDRVLETPPFTFFNTQSKIAKYYSYFSFNQFTEKRVENYKKYVSDTHNVLTYRWVFGKNKDSEEELYFLTIKVPQNNQSSLNSSFLNSPEMILSMGSDPVDYHLLKTLKELMECDDVDDIEDVLDSDDFFIRSNNQLKNNLMDKTTIEYGASPHVNFDAPLSAKDCNFTLRINKEVPDDYLKTKLGTEVTIVIWDKEKGMNLKNYFLDNGYKEKENKKGHRTIFEKRNYPDITIDIYEDKRFTFSVELPD